MNNFEFNIGDIVYLKTDKDQSERMVTGIMIRPNNIIYCLMCCTSETWHYGMEITKEKDVLKSMS